MSINPQKEIEELKKKEKSPGKPKATAKKRTPVNGQRNWGQTIAALAALVIFWLLVMVSFGAGIYYSEQVKAFFAAVLGS